MTSAEAKEWIVKLISTMKEETSGTWADPPYKDEVYEALSMAIKALSEPTTPVSVIEKIKAEIAENGNSDINAKAVMSIIDKAVKEIEHEQT